MGREPPTLLTPQCKRSFTAALMPVNGLVPGLPLMRPTFLIRLARVEEAAALSDLGFRSKAVWGYDPEFMALMPAALAVAPEDIAAGDVWIATRADEQIAGVVALAPGDAPGTLDLNKLFVEPRHIRSGVGRALLAHAVAEARQRGAERLTILADPNAAGFYERNGAVRLGEAPSDAVPRPSAAAL
jgi:GNAT superfamily N-acetyltransferase